MSNLQEITTEEEWDKHTSELPPTTLQVIYFHAPWAARKLFFLKSYTTQICHQAHGWLYLACKNMTTVLQTLASSYPVTQPLSTSWVSMNAEEVIEVSDSYNVTAVPFLVLTRNKQILETVSGSDATKVRAAIEKHAKESSTGTNGASATPSSGSIAKNHSNHTHIPSDSAIAPQSLSGESEQSKEDLHEKLKKLVKAAPVMLFMKGMVANNR